MSAPSGIAVGAWVTIAARANVQTGQVASPRRVDDVRQSVGSLDAAVSFAVAEPPGQASVADVCPDPLVFALEAGLPRLTGFDTAIDGGSAWSDAAPLGDGPLYAVSRIAEISERRASDGRLVVRVVYSTSFGDTTGVVVGTADGISIHIGESA